MKNIFKFILISLFTVGIANAQIIATDSLQVDTTGANIYTQMIELDDPNPNDKLIGIGITTNAPDTLMIQVWDNKRKTWLDMTYEGSPIQYPATDSLYIGVSPTKFAGISKIRIKNASVSDNTYVLPTKYTIFKRGY